MNCKNCGKAIEIRNGEARNIMTGSKLCGVKSNLYHEPEVKQKTLSNHSTVQIVNRLEIIDHREISVGTDDFGRRLVIWADDSFRVTESRQDGGRTLKIFLD